MFLGRVLNVVPAGVKMAKGLVFRSALVSFFVAMVRISAARLGELVVTLMMAVGTLRVEVVFILIVRRVVVLRAPVKSTKLLRRPLRLAR